MYLEFLWPSSPHAAGKGPLAVERNGPGDSAEQGTVVQVCGTGVVEQTCVVQISQLQGVDMSDLT